MHPYVSPVFRLTATLSLLAGAILGTPLLFPVAAIAQSLQERQAEGRHLYNQGMQQYQAEQLPEVLQSFLAALAIYRE